MAEQIKVLTIVLSENTNGEKFLSYYGNMLVVEAMTYCQEMVINEEKKKAIEEYKKGLENAD